MMFHPLIDEMSIEQLGVDIATLHYFNIPEEWRVMYLFLLRDGSCAFFGLLLLQGGAPKIAKLVYNSNNYGL